MRVLRRHFGALVLLAGCAMAQDSASSVVVLKDILVSDQNGRTQVELVTSAPVEPLTSVATHPDRLLIELPGTIDGTNLSKMEVKSRGVRSVDIVRTPILPGRTRIVVELDHPFACQLGTENGHISLLFVSADSGLGSQGAVAAAKGGTLTGIFRHDKGPQVSYVERVHEPTPAAAAGRSFTARQAPSVSNEVTSFPSAVPEQQTTATGNAAVSGSLLRPAPGGAAVVPTPRTADISGSAPPIPQSAAVSVMPAPTVPQVSATAPASASNRTKAGASAQAAAEPNPLSVSDTTVPSTAPSQHLTAAAPTSAPVETKAPTTQPAAADYNPQRSDSAETDNETIAANTASEPRLAIRAADPSLRTVFKVKYVAEGVAYLDGGRSAGLKEGVKLEIRDANLPAQDGTSVAPTDPRVVAELEVSAVAESSSVSDIHDPKRAVKVGDLAYLSSADADALVQAKALSPTRQYPAVVSFTEGDPEDEEVRDEMPRPPLPSVNRARGRFGFDYMGTVSHGANSMTSSSMGMMFRGDITRINGTYWDLSGYWRGRLTSESPAGAKTLQDLINRTYHLSMTYDNPNSSWVAGFGRLYLPWANSLDTIDGGYVGRKFSETGTAGIFGGSTPDPTSYDYAPNQAIGGGFVNFTGGDFAKFHYSSTMGAGLSMLQWQPNRPFGFLENTISYTRNFSVYDALQVDSPNGNPVVPSPGPGLSRNFFTARVQATPRLELDFNHTYFRDIPTYDPTLVGTGLLDKYLFQGFSGGARFEFMKNATVYTQLGRSSRTGDTSSSLNEMFGITFSKLPIWALRADFHYAQFNSAFGSGKYKAFSISRSLTDSIQADVLVGQQSFNSLMTISNKSWFAISNIQTNFGSHYFLEGSWTTNRGQMSYDQWMFTLGYRFDSKRNQR